MDKERFEDLKESYVLGALPEDERLEFERYLAAHPERQAEVDELGAFADLLAFSPHQQEPSPELRRRIMDTVEAEAAQTRAQQPRFSRRSWLAGLWEAFGVRDFALAGAAVLVVGLFSWGMLLQEEVQDLQGRVQGLQAQVQNQQSQGPHMIALGGAGTEQGARAELVTLEGDRAVLVAEGMPPVPEGKTYQIWVIKGDTPRPSGLFEPKGDSIAAVVEETVEGADAVAVTVEPEGGSKKPTSDPMLVGKVKA